MIVTVRGANGSGKSTLVRRVLDLHARETMYVTGRKRPFGYLCKSLRDGVEKLFVLGAYETPTGGCDTISDAATIYDTIEQMADIGYDVLFEGIIAQHNTTRLLNVMKNRAVEVIQLTTSLEDCIASVQARRLTRGNDAPFDPRNVVKEYRSVISSCDRMRDHGHVVHKLDREEALRRVCLTLGVPFTIV